MGATDFTPIRGAIWEGETAKACKGDPIALWLLAFLPTHFANHSTGVFRLQLDFVSFRFGIPEAALLDGIAKLEATGFVKYDRKTDWVFVTRLAEIRHPNGFMTPGRRPANMAVHFARHIAACPSAEIRDAFNARYGASHMPLDGPERSVSPRAIVGTETLAESNRPDGPERSVSEVANEKNRSEPSERSVSARSTVGTKALAEKDRSDGNARRAGSSQETETETETAADAATRARTHAREAAAAGDGPQGTTPSRPAMNRTSTEPEPEQEYDDDGERWEVAAAEPSIETYLAELRKGGKEPQGDVIAPFERAAIYLRDHMKRPREAIPNLMVSIVKAAASTSEFRQHSRHGDLFLRPEAVMGRRMGAKDGLGVEVKVPEWMNKVAKAPPRYRPPEPEPEPEPPTPEQMARVRQLLAEGKAKIDEIKRRQAGGA